MTGRSLSLPMATHTLRGDDPAAREALPLRALATGFSLSRRCGSGAGRVILAERTRAGETSRVQKSGGGVRGARPDRLRALAAIQETVAGEAVTVAGEEVGHLFLPGVDAAHSLVIGHAAHLEKQADGLPRLGVDPEELEDPARAGGAVHVLLRIPHEGMLARAPTHLNARPADPRGRRSSTEPGSLSAYLDGPIPAPGHAPRRFRECPWRCRCGSTGPRSGWPARPRSNAPWPGRRLRRGR